MSFICYGLTRSQQAQPVQAALLKCKMMVRYPNIGTNINKNSKIITRDGISES